MPPKGVAQIGLRVPEALRMRLQFRAERAGRSLNSEMLRRLEASLETDTRIQELSERILALEATAKEDAATLRTLSLALAATTPGAITAAVQKMTAVFEKTMTAETGKPEDAK
jgi:hypothetical protein